MKIEESDRIGGQVGRWCIEVFEGDSDRKIDEIRGENLITNAGKGLILDLLAGINGAAKLTGLATGTNNTAAAVGNTSITNEQFIAFEETPSRTGLTTTYKAFYGTGDGNINIQELGMLTGPGGTLFNRLAPIGPFNKTSAVSIRIIVTITQS